MANHVYRQALTFNVASEFGQSIFHWEFDDSGFATSFAAAAQLLAAWDTAYNPSFGGFFPADVLLVSQKAARVTGGGGFEAIEDFGGGGIVGTRAGNFMVAGVNPVAVFYPLDTNRRRGRWFIPGVTDQDLISGRYTDAYKTAINTLLGTQFDDLTLIGGGAPVAKFCIFDRKNVTNFKPVLNTLSDTPGTQRRRQRPALS